MDTEGVVYDELPVAGLVRFNRPITIRGFLRYGRVNGKIVSVQIKNAHGTTTVPYIGTYVEEHPTTHHVSEVPEDD